MNELITLYKPLTPQQLAVVITSGWRTFVPEFPEQTHFFAKLHQRYAELIARMWCVSQYSAGYVAVFEVEDWFIGQYDIVTIAYEEHREYQIPIEDLDSLNRHIVGPIDVISAFQADLSTQNHSKQHNHRFTDIQANRYQSFH